MFTLDPSPAEDRLLRSYCGAARKAYNWALGEVTANLAARKAEQAAGVPEKDMTPTLSWSAWSLSKRWNSVKEVEAPWWREVSKHAFSSGITAAANALKNWHDSKTGKRKGRRMGFPSFKSKRQAALSVTFVEANHQLSWLHPDRHHVRLMLPQASPDPEFRRHKQHLAWLHTVESTGRLYRLVQSGDVTIQKVTISLRGGRWRAAFQIRYRTAPAVRRVGRLGAIVGVDAGVRHLATLSQPVAGLTDENGHIPNPNVLRGQLHRLRKLDRQVARAEQNSKSRARLVRRRARLHGQIAKTRALYLHRVTTALAGGFDVVAVEDLNLAGMANRKRHLGRRLADVGLGELRRQFAYKTADHGHQLVAIGRFYPSSKTCSSCGAVKAKLPLWERIFTCDTCGTTCDRDVNAARSIAREALRLLGWLIRNSKTSRTVPGYDRNPKTPPRDPIRPQRRKPRRQGRPRGEPSSRQASRRREHLDGALATASGTATG